MENVLTAGMLDRAPAKRKKDNINEHVTHAVTHFVATVTHFVATVSLLNEETFF